MTIPTKRLTEARQLLKKATADSEGQGDQVPDLPRGEAINGSGS